MEIWRVKNCGTKSNPRYVWVKKPFRTKHFRGPINNLFGPSMPFLASLVQEELRRSKDQRYIVFSEEEQKKLFKIGRYFLNPERGTVASQFLHCVLSPVRECWRGGFSVTFVREDNPSDSLGEEKAPIRLAIMIDE